MRRLAGQVISGTNYALQGRVLEKYAPKLDARSFFVRLDGVRPPIWFAVAHFSKFEPMDVIGVADYREGDQGLWVRPRDTVVVIQPAVVLAREVTLELGYVSNPRHVAGQYWYMFKLTRWHRCHYDVAARYWLGDSVSQDSLLAADYYTLLGVDKDASFPSIRSAWKRMIVEHHPDRFVSGYGQEVLAYHGRLAARINAARDCLTDVGERERYDQQLQLGHHTAPRQEEVRAWPARGFGTLWARVEDRGTVVLVKEILSWEPERHVFEGAVSLGEVRIWGETAQLRIPILDGVMQVGHETLRIPNALLPVALVQAIGQRRKGELTYRFKGIRTGGYSMKKGVYTWIRVQEADVTWTPIRDVTREIQRKRHKWNIRS